MRLGGVVCRERGSSRRPMPPSRTSSKPGPSGPNCSIACACCRCTSPAARTIVNPAAGARPSSRISATPAASHRDDLGRRGRRARPVSHWPGNVRELRHVLERVLAGGAPTRRFAPVICQSTCSRDRGPSRTGRWPAATLDEVERRYIALTLHRTRGNQTRAAAILGINRKALWEKRKRFGGISLANVAVLKAAFAPPCSLRGTTGSASGRLRLPALLGGDRACAAGRLAARQHHCDAAAGGDCRWSSLREIVHAFKCAGRRSLAAPLGGSLMRPRAARAGSHPSCLCTLHPWRRMQRGFNQADDLARTLHLPVHYPLATPPDDRPGGTPPPHSAGATWTARSPSHRWRHADGARRSAEQLSCWWTMSDDGRDPLRLRRSAHRVGYLREVRVLPDGGRYFAARATIQAGSTAA